MRGGRKFRQAIGRALGVSSHIPRVWSFPTFLLEAPAEYFQKRRGRTKADVGAMLLRRYGLECEAARTNVFGYAEFLHDLTAVAPWDESILDIEDDPAFFPDPLYVVANQRPLRELETLYRDYCEYIGTTRIPADVDPERAGEFIGERLFKDKLTFARCLGIESFEKLYRCLFDRYRFWLVDGAPDLIVWDPRPGSDFWFLAEVKGPRDCLSKSQLNWIRSRWKSIQGRFLVLIVEPERSKPPSAPARTQSPEVAAGGSG